MSNLVNEILLRLAKLLFAGIVGAIVYLVATGLGHVAGSFEVAALSFICGAVSILLVESSPL